MANPRRRTRALGIPAALVLIAAALTGCAASGDDGGPSPELHGQWELQSATDATGILPLANQHITLTIAGDQTTNGRSTCSDYTAHVFGSTSKLWITTQQSGAQTCDSTPQEQLETRYIRDLRAVHYGTIKGGILTLQSTKLTMTFSRAIYVPLTLVTGRNWQIQTIAPDVISSLVTEENQTTGVLDSLPAKNNFSPISASGANIRFSTSGKLTVNDPCRVGSAAYKENAGELVLDGLTTTKIGCGEDAAQVDTYLASVLTTGFTWQSANGQLVIDSPRAGVRITFVEDSSNGRTFGGGCSACASTS